MKWVVDENGVGQAVEETEEELAQQVKDAAATAARRAAELAENGRIDTFLADTGRREFITKLKTASASDIETFVQNKINVDGVTDLASAKACLKRMETAFTIMVKLLVEAVKR